MTNWYAHGEPVKHLAVDDRGLQYGDGLFETIAIRNGEPRLWNRHTERLGEGCNLLGIAMPPERDLHDGVMQAVSASGVMPAYAVAKIMMTAGTSSRGYGRERVQLPSVLFGAFAATPPPAVSYTRGIEVALCNTRLASNSAFAGIKTLNRLEQVLARSEIIATDAFEGLTMDADDNIICGTMSNVFFVQNNTLTTAPVDRSGVSGVMRRHVIESLKKQGVDTQLQYTDLPSLDDVDEVFLSNSQFGVMPVSRCASRTWPVGSVTRNVMSVMAEAGIDECRQ